MLSLSGGGGGANNTTVPPIYSEKTLEGESKRRGRGNIELTPCGDGMTAMC